MSQHDMNLANADGATFRADLNNALAALASVSSGASAPTTTFPYMLWADTTSGWIKQRNAADSAWIMRWPLAGARVDVASASTLDLDAVTAEYVRITGTTTVTAVTLTDGQVRHAVANAAFQLTNGASLVLPGAANYTTTAGDILHFYGESGGVVRVEINVPRSTYTTTQKWAKGADVASANALALGTDGNYFDITGTTAITSINTVGVGAWIKLHFDGALTLTHHATDLILPGGANITTAAGDEAEFVEYATGDWRCTCYTKANGQAVVSSASGGITLATPVASTSGTSIDFTSIPAGTKRITVMLSGVSTNGTSVLLAQLGDSGGVENTGYDSVVDYPTNYGGTSTAGFRITYDTVAANTYHSKIDICLLGASTNTWVATYTTIRGSTAGSCMYGMGKKSLSATLDRVRITTANGTDTFDAGTINISYE